MTPFDGRRFLLTGVTSDIGRALVAHLERDSDCRLVLVSRSPCDARRLGFRREHTVIDGIDLTSSHDLGKLEDTVTRSFDRPFCAIHSVGTFWHHKSITDTSLTEAHEMMMSHYMTLYGLAKSTLPTFVRVGGGRILAFSCNSVRQNYPDMAAFTSAKAAIETLVQCIANEYADKGVVANAMALSTIRTPKVEASKAERYHEYYVNLEELAQSVVEVATAPTLMNGNVVRLLKYSPYFYNEGYYQRNPPSKA
jgi:short-subunit dehydrogenase